MTCISLSLERHECHGKVLWMDARQGDQRLWPYGMFEDKLISVRVVELWNNLDDYVLSVDDIMASDRERRKLTIEYAM